MDLAKAYTYVSEIARCRSISAAAENLNIQQPALSKYLKNVEVELGAELFDRSVSPIALTAAGTCYLEAARKIIDTHRQLKKQISDLKQSDRTVRFGISPSRAPYLLPSILMAFRAARPDIRVSVSEGTTDELSTALTRGDLDVILSLEDDATKEFEHRELFTESVVLAVPENAGYQTFKEAFSSLNIIASGKGQWLTELLDSMPGHRSMTTCQNAITSLELVRSGLGAALVPSYMADFGNRQGLSFLPLPASFQPRIRRTISLFYRKEQFLSDAEKAFLDAAASATLSRGE